jgi:hypothetical protein
VFGMGVERQDDFTEADDEVMCSTIHGKNFAAMSADDAELFDMLLLRPSLAINVLLALEVLGYVGITYCGFAHTMEIRAVEWE